jgi:hypothetical protein
MSAKAKITHNIGVWSWNHDGVIERLEKNDNDNDCVGWTGSSSGHANIFGGKKSGKPQMNSANRFIWMAHYNQDIPEHSVHMSCGNIHCSNIKHMFLKPNYRQGYREQ